MKLKNKFLKYSSLFFFVFFLTFFSNFNSFANVWKLEGSLWKLYNEQNTALSGWVYENNFWYFLDTQNQVMKTAWHKDNNGYWYFLQSNKGTDEGKMLTGWHWIDGYAYYFNTIKGSDEGKLLTSARTPDAYLVDADGRWLGTDNRPVYIAGKGIITKKNNVNRASSGARSSGSRVSSGGGSRVSSGGGLGSVSSGSFSGKSSGSSLGGSSSGVSSGSSLKENLKNDDSDKVNIENENSKNDVPKNKDTSNSESVGKEPDKKEDGNSGIGNEAESETGSSEEEPDKKEDENSGVGNEAGSETGGSEEKPDKKEDENSGVGNEAGSETGGSEEKPDKKEDENSGVGNETDSESGVTDGTEDTNDGSSDNTNSNETDNTKSEDEEKIVAIREKLSELKNKLNELKDKSNEILSDSLVNPTEKLDLDNLISQATDLKEEIKTALESLENTEKRDELKQELSDIHIPEGLKVNDEDANNKIDTKGDVDSIKEKLESLKTKIEEVKTKLSDISSDEIITQDEKTDLDNLREQANKLKEDLKSALNNLEDSDEKDKLTSAMDEILVPESVEITKPKKELEETKIEFKNVESAYLYKLNENNEFEKVLSIADIDDDLTKYKVKLYLEDAKKNIWLDVDAIKPSPSNDKYIVELVFDDLVKINENLEISDKYTIEVAKRNTTTSEEEYTSFSSMLEGMKAKSEGAIISGTYIIADNMTASEVSVTENDKSYLDNYTFTGTLKSKEGKVFSISDMKKPLFNVLLNSKISNLVIKDADISVERYDEVGTLANNVSGSTINNVNANGRIIGNSAVGGLIGTLDNTSRLINSAFEGSVSSLHSAGGLVSRVSRGSSISNSYADVNISVSARHDSNIGGITGELGHNSSIENSYVKGNLHNNGDSSAKVGGAIGVVYDVLDEVSDEGKIINVISYIEVNNGMDFIGNIADLKVLSKKDIRNNYLVTNFSKGIHTDFDSKFVYIDENDAKIKADSLYTDIEVSPIIDNSSKVNYSGIKDYRENYKIAYENLAKILPFYDRYTIVREANKLSQSDSLNSKKIKSIQVFTGDELLKSLYEQKYGVDKIVIYYEDDSREELDVNFNKEFNSNGIIEYNILNKNILYNPNRLAKNNRELVKNIAKELKTKEYNYTIFNPHNLSEWTERDKNILVEKLYLKDNFDSVKGEVEDTLVGLVDNYDIGDYTKGKLKTYLKNKLESNKNAVLVGLNYLDRWYDFSTVKNNLLYSLDMYPTNNNSLDLILGIGSKPIGILNSKLTDSAYEQVISKYTGISNISEFIKKAYIDTRQNEDIDEWIKETSKAYIVNTKSKSLEKANESLFERLSRPKLRRFILPMLTIKERNVYAFFTTNSSNFGIYDPYMTVKDKDSAKYKEEAAAVEKKVNDSAKAMQGYFDALYRILDQKSVERLLNEKIQVFDSYKNSRKTWSAEYGDGAFSSVKALAGPVGRWIRYEAAAGAYALNSNSIEVVHFSAGSLLTERGLSTLTHEHVHNLDKKILLEGYSRRFGHGAESFAMGLLQSPIAGSEYLGINLVYEVGKSDRYLLTHNSSPDRFQNIDDLQKYMKGVFDVLYTLDLAEAEVIIEEGDEYIQDRYKKLSAVSEYINSNNNIDKIGRINSSLRIRNLDDLINANIIGGEPTSKEYGNNDYININMFNAHYGINENPNGVSGGFTFRRVAFELLAEKGYYDGMLPYISNKYYYTDKNVEDENTKSDTYILKRMFDGKYENYKQFRKAMFDKRNDKKNDLKSVRVWGVRNNNQLVDINSFNDIKKLMKQAINSKNPNALITLKRNIYHEYLILTNEFRDSIYKSE